MNLLANESVDRQIVDRLRQDAFCDASVNRRGRNFERRSEPSSFRRKPESSVPGILDPGFRRGDDLWREAEPLQQFSWWRCEAQPHDELRGENSGLKPKGSGRETGGRSLVLWET